MTIQTRAWRVVVHESFEAATPAWRRLEERGHALATQRLSWLRHWHTTVGRGFVERLTIVEVEADGEPLMLLPLGVLRLGGAACVTFLGGDITDYHAPLLAADYSARAPSGGIAVVWDAIREALPGHDAVRFHKQPERIGDLANPLLDLPGTVAHDVNHVCAIEGDWDAFYPTLVSSRLRGDTRRKRRRLTERGRLDFAVASTAADRRAFTDWMIEQKIARYTATGTYNLFNDPAYRDFFLAPSPDLVEAGLLHVSALTLDGVPLATHWGLAADGRFYFVMAGFAAGEWQRFSPGRLLIEDLIRWCADHGFREFDFTIGDEDFKPTWSNRKRTLFRYSEAHTLHGRAFCARERFADWVRDRPGLHRRISRLRNSLGR